MSKRSTVCHVGKETKSERCLKETNKITFLQNRAIAVNCLSWDFINLKLIVLKTAGYGTR